MAGNGTIGLELMEDLPDVDAVIVPWGGGGLACGIASVVKALRPSVRVYTAEAATAAPLAAALKAGAPQVVDYTPSFVDGIGEQNRFSRNASGSAAASGRLDCIDAGRDRGGAQAGRGT